MKKIIIALILAISLISCSNQENNENPFENKAEKEEAKQRTILSESTSQYFYKFMKDLEKLDSIKKYVKTGKTIPLGSKELREYKYISEFNIEELKKSKEINDFLNERINKKILSYSANKKQQFLFIRDSFDNLQMGFNGIKNSDLFFNDFILKRIKEDIKIIQKEENYNLYDDFGMITFEEETYNLILKANNYYEVKDAYSMYGF